MTLIVLRNTVFKMINIWQHHARTDMQKRLASVHSIIVRGSLIPNIRKTREIIGNKSNHITLIYSVL